MKKTIIGTLALLAGATAVFAQGQVEVGNYGVLATYIYVSYKAANGQTTLLGGSAGTTGSTTANYASEIAKGSDWTVQLYGAPGSGDASSTLVALPGMTATFATGSPDPAAGTWYSSSIYAFPTTPAGSTVTVQLEAWYNAGGSLTTLAEAQAAGVPTGASMTETVTLDAATGTPPAVLVNGGALGNFDVIPTPEPSTIALGVIGASAFLMRLRRKS